MSLQHFQNHRLGRFSDDDSILSLAEFPVTKHSRRHSVSSSIHAQSNVSAVLKTCTVEPQLSGPLWEIILVGTHVHVHGYM